MSRVHFIKQVQKLPVPLEQAWGFFANPENLLRLTPPAFNLKVTNKLQGGEIYSGQIITYKVKPLLGITFFWMTEITHVERHKLFIDEQRKGPYALWHHQHHFKSIKGGTEMTDILQYKLPFGILGGLGVPIVKKQLDKIFTYRHQAVDKLFGVLS